MPHRTLLNLSTHEMKLPNVVKGDGCYVIDEDGRRYLDMESGVWCLSLGHGHPAVNEAISAQIREIMHCGFNYSTPGVNAAAQLVAEKTGIENARALFLCSGSEAVEVGRQLSRHLTGKSLSMTLHDSYLGSYESLKKRESGWVLFDWRDCDTCTRGESCDPACERLQRIPEEVSEFIFEPGSSSGFVRFPPESLVKNIVETIRRRGGLIVVNDVTTGIGRTGRWFGFQHYPISPDIVAMGKGIGNGYPVSAVVISGKLARVLETSPYIYSQSHQNDALGARVAATVIRTIETNRLIDNAEKMGRYLINGLEQLVNDRIILRVRGRGLMVAMDMPDAKTTREFHHRLLEQGIVVGNRGTSLRADPPLIVTAEMVDKFISTVSDISQSM